VTFPFPPPAPEDWQLSDETSNTFSVVLLDPGLAPTDGFALEYTVNGGPWLDGGTQNNFAGIFIPGNPPGATIEAHIRWYDLGSATPESDWSATQIVVIT